MDCEPGLDSEMQQRRQQETRVETTGGRKNGPSRVGDALLQDGDGERGQITAVFFDERDRVGRGLAQRIVA